MKKKTRIFSVKIRDFFFGRKKNSDFQCRNPRFFRPKKKSRIFALTEIRVFFLKKILCLSCISHCTKRQTSIPYLKGVKCISYFRPKWFKFRPYFRSNRLKNHTLWLPVQLAVLFTGGKVWLHRQSFASRANNPVS